MLSWWSSNALCCRSRLARRSTSSRRSAQAKAIIAGSARLRPAYALALPGAPEHLPAPGRVGPFAGPYGGLGGLAAVPDSGAGCCTASTSPFQSLGTTKRSTALIGWAGPPWQVWPRPVPTRGDGRRQGPARLGALRARFDLTLAVRGHLATGSDPPRAGLAGSRDQPAPATTPSDPLPFSGGWAGLCADVRASAPHWHTAGSAGSRAQGWSREVVARGRGSPRSSHSTRRAPRCPPRTG